MANIFEQSKSLFNAWQDSQKKLLEQYQEWGKQFQSQDSATTGKENSFLGNWVETQQKLSEQFMETCETIQKNMLTLSNSANYKEINTFFDHQIFQQMYRYWLDTLGRSFQSSSLFPFQSGFKEQQKFLEELWLKNGPFSVFWKANDANRIFFDLFGSLIGNTSDLYAPFMDTFSAFSRKAMEVIQTGKGMQDFEEILKTGREKFRSLLQTPKLGIHGQKYEKIARILDSYMDFMQNLYDLLKVISETSRKSSNRLSQKLGNIMAKGESINSFQEFSRLWTKENEVVFQELMGTSSFSKLQGNFLNSYYQFKNLSNELIEDLLKDTPIAVKKDQDLAFKEIYRLKAEMKSLKRTIKGLAEERNEKKKRPSPKGASKGSPKK